MDKIFSRHNKPTIHLRRILMKEQQGKCADCGANDYDLDKSLQIHRVKPGGEYSPDNTILLCSKCHHAVTRKARR